MVDMDICTPMNTFQLGAFGLVLYSFIQRSGPFSKISEQSLITLMILLITYATPLFTQPLSQPAEGFKCGPLNLTCDRWGFVACLSPDEDYYCIPCDVEYLEDLCGTKDEVQGCNLYCTKLAVDREMERMRAEFDEKIVDLHKNFTNNMSNTNTEFAKINSVSLKTQSYLRKHLTSCENERLGLFICASVFFAFLIAAVVSFAIYFKIRHKQGVNEDFEQKEKQELLDTNSSWGTLTEEGEDVQTRLHPDILDKEVKTDTAEVIQAVCKQEQEQATSEEQEDCSEDNCQGNKKLRNVNPTNEAIDDKNKYAIHRNDHDYTQNI